MQSKNSGFTLIELSIVLVIIGLLTAGILIAQSLIKSAEINSFVRYISQSDIAVMSFKSKYNVLPGDSTLFGGSGNRDGIISDSQFLANPLGYGTYFNMEVAGFWRELSLSGYKPENVIYSNNGLTGVDIGVHIPAANIGGKDTGIMAVPRNTSLSGPGGVVNKHYNWYYLADYSATTTEHWNGMNGYTNGVSPIDSMAIDVKMDDGLPVHTGIVRAHTKNGTAGLCFNTAPHEYLTNDNLECVLMIAITPPIF